MFGETFQKIAFLVVEDPTSTAMEDRKRDVPGVIGANILREVKDTIPATASHGNNESCNSWAPLFALCQQLTLTKDDDDLGYCDVIKHRIILTDNIPVKVPHRRIPPHQWNEVREYMRKAIDRGIVRESSSPYASAVVLVRKHDGSLRLCVDYLAVNAKTHKDAYPLPRIDEALDAFHGAKYFCSLDLAHGYHQIPVAEDDIEKTAFRLGTGGLYEFTRMPFGLCNAPATFMRLMDKAFGDQTFQSVLIYLDDILVFGSTIEETMQRLDMVLTRLAKLNLKVKSGKCIHICLQQCC